MQTQSATALSLDDLTLEPLDVALRALGYEKSSFYQEKALGLVTPPVKLGLRCSRLPRFEIVALARARIAGATPDQRRALVRELLQRRAALMPALPTAAA